jgi:archaellum component FlaG (FlaF/FlaG flagellin family)
MDVRQIKDADIADELQNWSQQFDQDFQVINTPAEADAASARGSWSYY